MPAFESRRVRTQPFTVIATSFGASPAKILRTLNVSSVHAQRLSQSFVKSQLSKAKCGSNRYGIKRYLCTGQPFA